MKLSESNNVQKYKWDSSELLHVLFPQLLLILRVSYLFHYSNSMNATKIPIQPQNMQRGLSQVWHNNTNKRHQNLKWKSPEDPLALCKTAKSCFRPSLVYAALFFLLSPPPILYLKKQVFALNTGNEFKYLCCESNTYCKKQSSLIQFGMNF